MNREIVLRNNSGLEQAKTTYLAGMSPNTQRAYDNRIARFVIWRERQEPAPFVAQLKNYVAHLQAEGLSPRSVQQHVNTIKGLIKTMAALDIAGHLASQLPQLDLVKAPAVRGETQGNRLTEQQRQILINQPGTDTHKGRRDTAVLGVLAVCGLRRSEVCSMNWHHITEMDGHKVIRNLKGKHGRIRTVKLPPPLWRGIVTYAERAGLNTAAEEPVFVAIRKGDRVQHGQRITPNAVAFLVEYYIKEALEDCDDISPHDLRRTAAKLARNGGASIEQVQAMLGHASPQTTSAYIGEGLDLDDNAVDYGKVKWPW